MCLAFHRIIQARSHSASRCGALYRQRLHTDFRCCCPPCAAQVVLRQRQQSDGPCAPPKTRPPGSLAAAHPGVSARSVLKVAPSVEWRRHRTFWTASCLSHASSAGSAHSLPPFSDASMRAGMVRQTPLPAARLQAATRPSQIAFKARSRSVLPRRRTAKCVILKHSLQPEDAAPCSSSGEPGPAPCTPGQPAAPSPVDLQRLGLSQAITAAAPLCLDGGWGGRGGGSSGDGSGGSGGGGGSGRAPQEICALADGSEDEGE